MSIHIGTLPVISPTATPFTIATDRSNVARFTADTNVYMEFDKFRIGQTSNSESDYYFTVEEITTNERIITFSKDNISFWKPLSSTEEIEFDNQVIITSNLKALEIDADKIILTDNSHTPITLSNDGTMFLEGLLTADFVHITSNLNANTIYTNAITFNSNINGIFFTNSNIILEAPTVEIRNVQLPGLVTMENVDVTNNATFDGQITASNIVLFNKPLTHPLEVRQKLINNQFANSLGDPISVKADFPESQNLTTFQLSHRGHLVMGGSTVPKDYMLRGFIHGFRDQHFDGFVSFTNSNTGLDSFTINKNANVSIGNTTSTSMFEVRNNYIGNEQYYSRPSSLVTLQNAQSTNRLPYLQGKLPNGTTKFQFTSNGTLSFFNTPLNLFKYDIETSNPCFFGDIEVNSIKANTGSIDLNNSSLSNITDIQANTGTLSNVYIYNLTVDNLFTDSLDCFETLNDPQLLKVLSRRFLINSSNIVINQNRNFISNSNALTNDNLAIYTNGTITDSVRSIYVTGTNNQINERTENTATTVGSRVTKDMSANNFNYQIGVRNRNTTPTTDAILYISPANNNTDLTIINDTNAALNIFNDRTVKIGASTYITANGRVTINQSTAHATDYNLFARGPAVFISDITASTVMELANTGNVGIGTSAAAQRLRVNGTASFVNASGTNLLRIQDTSIGFGTSTNLYPYHVNLDSTFTNPVSCLSNVTIHGRLDTLGNVASTSDATLKTNLQPIKQALQKLETLTGYTYDRVDTQEKETGLLAQEVAHVLPEAVHRGTNGLYHLAYGNLAGLLVESIKELSRRVKRLEALIE